MTWALLAADDAGQVSRALAAALAVAGPDEAKRLYAASAVIEGRPAAFDLVRRIVAAVDHDDWSGSTATALARLRDGFDRAASVSPDAAAALYSLGDPDLLTPITGEVVAWITAAGLIPRGSALLEVGCGPGRYLSALAPTAGLALGVELSAVMAAEATRRLAGNSNAAVVRGSGRDLVFLADAAFDLVLYADSFPYIVQAGGDLAQRHIAESARVLRPGGALLVLNWSYVDDVADHVEEARRLAAAVGLRPVQLGLKPFARWDAATFVFRKPDDAAA